MKQTQLTLIFLFLVFLNVSAQEVKGLDFYLIQAKNNTPVLLENRNLEQIGELQNNLIIAQNRNKSICHWLSTGKTAVICYVFNINFKKGFLGKIQ
jgi:hypothetical protein